MIRLGRISYVNMAPVFHRLTHEVEEVVGVPTELNRLLLAGEIDVAPISSIEYARNASRLRLMPRLCVSSEGAVDSIQLVSRVPLGRIRSVAVRRSLSSRELSTTRARRRAAISAVASPIPLEAPVITSTCSLSGFSVTLMFDVPLKDCGARPGPVLRGG